MTRRWHLAVSMRRTILFDFHSSIPIIVYDVYNFLSCLVKWSGNKLKLRQKTELFWYLSQNWIAISSRRTFLNSRVEKSFHQQFWTLNCINFVDRRIYRSVKNYVVLRQLMDLKVVDQRVRWIVRFLQLRAGTFFYLLWLMQKGIWELKAVNQIFIRKLVPIDVRLWKISRWLIKTDWVGFG